MRRMPKGSGYMGPRCPSCGAQMTPKVKRVRRHFREKHSAELTESDAAKIIDAWTRSIQFPPRAMRGLIAYRPKATPPRVNVNPDLPPVRVVSGGLPSLGKRR